jgi:hypothetical protein
MQKITRRFEMKKSMLTVLLTVLVIIFISCKGAQGPAGASGASGTEFTAVFQQGIYPDPSYNGTTDSYISDAYPNTNYGQCSQMLIGTMPGQRYRSLLRMDVSSITPINAIVTNAYLTLNAAVYSGNTGITLTAYALSEPFPEGSGPCSGIDATNFHFATWMWFTTPGGSYTRAISGPQYFDTSGNGSTLLQLTLDAATVQSWIQNPGANYGMLLMAVENTAITEYAGFVTKDDTYYGNTYRPKLTVFYKLP